jgi:hypothetical protein
MGVGIVPNFLLGAPLTRLEGAPEKLHRDFGQKSKQFLVSDLTQVPRAFVYKLILTWKGNEYKRKNEICQPHRL